MDNKREKNNIDIRDGFFDEVYDIASKDKNVIFITADADAFSLEKYKKDLPEQFINIGVAEQNMIAVAAGLALSGKKVFVYSMIPFIAMRCYEHIKTNICGMNLAITIIGVGAGLSFENDGPTHHAVADIAVMRTLPEITILNPADSCSAAVCANFAYQSRSPVYVRLDKGIFPVLTDGNNNFSDGLRVLRNLKDINIISTGFMSHQAVKVAKELEKNNIGAGVADLYMIKPVNKEALLRIIEKSKQLITLEENSAIGGIGDIVSNFLIENKKYIPLKMISLKDEQCFNYGSRGWLHKNYCLDVESVVKSIMEENLPQKNTSNPGQFLFNRKITVDDFARSFGATPDDILFDCRELIEKNDFRYRIIEGEERDNIILNVLKKIEIDNQIIGAETRTAQWETGWSENLKEFIESNYDLNKITPKFIRSNQVIRFNQQYIMPVDPNFEHDYFNVFRTWFFRKYLKDYNDIYDFGCGSGYNLVPMAKMYPDKNFYGLDFVPSSPELINRIANAHNLKIKGYVFNLRQPNESFEVKPGAAVFTSGTIEQIASDFEPFLQFLLKQSPGICIHIEPIIETYDENNLVDYLAIKFHKKRGYTQGYLTRLRELEAEGKIKILKVKRLFFGSLYMEGFTYIIWKPVK
ncbi:MAG: hypothetical protein US88_C0003G0025 [Parcubacteria group bacterium GW2011_GWA2_38_27]|nr:MAG: hypothetical protein US88_C0003G0025 [Parcubacteria group bacterium GW2011_GWA2_38_27]